MKNTVTVYEKAAAVDFKKIQELAKSLYENLTEFRENYIIKEDSEENPDNNFAYLDGALNELLQSEITVGE